MNPFAELSRPLICRPGMVMPEPAKSVKSRRRGPPRPKAAPNPWDLNVSQSDYIQRICDGQGNVEIAAATGTPLKTIEASLASVREKMKANNRTHAAVMWDRFKRKGEVIFKEQA